MKWFKRILTATLLMPVFVLLAWYILGFWPYISDINKIAENGKRNVATVEEKLFKMAMRSERGSGLRSLVIRSTYRLFSLKGERQKMLYWHLNTAFWYYASHIHFNEKEIFYLWSELAWYGAGTGLAEAASHYFKKPLGKLSNVEMASLVAITRSPSLYKLRSERLDNRVKYILGQ